MSTHVLILTPATKALHTNFTLLTGHPRGTVRAIDTRGACESAQKDTRPQNVNTKSPNKKEKGCERICRLGAQHLSQSSLCVV